MAKSKLQLEKELQEAINKALVERATIQAKVNSSFEGYLETLKDVKKNSETIKDVEERILEYKEEAKKFEKDKSEEGKKAYKAAKITLDILEKENAALIVRQGLLVQSIKTAKLGNIAFTKFASSAVKGLSKLPDLIQNSFGQIKKLGVFEMDKAIRMSALQMGILGKSTDSFRKDISAAAIETLSMGVGIDELAKMQSEYTDNLGRNVMLNKEGLKAMAQMAVVTGLGAEGTAKMAADFENQGLSAERTQKTMQNTIEDTTKLGLNAAKTFKNIASSTKMLNKYNFKDGVKGLTAMAKIVTKLGVGMEFATGMADKLFDIEGAVDMSAQLQVMGGAWAKLADPFHLMYMARNDMAGLTEELGKAAESAAHFNSKTGEFDISALEMHRLRKIAEQTGASYEELAQAGKNAAKFTKIRSQLSFTMKPEEKEFLVNTSKIDEQGKAYIIIDGSTKFLNQLTTADKKILKAQILEKQNMKKRAEASQTFDEALTNTTNMFKVAMLPILEGFNKDLMPKLDKFVDRFIKDKWADKIGEFARIVGGLAATIGGLIVDNPIMAGAAYLTAKIGGWFFDKASWILNGIALAKGFNIASGGGGMGAGLKSMGGTLGGGLGKVGGGSIGRGAAMAGGLGIGGMIIGGATEAFTDPGSGMDIIGTAVADGMTGAAIGSFLGPVGMAIGGILGAAYGGISAAYSKPDILETQNDAFIGKPIHDGSIGGDFSKGRGIIQGGKITPIDNKDDLIAMKPSGPIHKAINQANSTQTNIKIDFGEIHFKFDELKVSSPGSPGLAIDLLKNPQFIRDITRMVHVETEKVIQGGKVKG